MVDSLTLPSERATQLYRLHGRAIRAYLGAKISDGDTVDDLCQETFLAAFDQDPPSQDLSEVGRWLFGIARNKMRKHYRDRKTASPLDSGRVSAVSAPPAALGEREERERVRGAVHGLEEELKEVIVLRYEGGLRYREIALRLELPLSTVQGRLKRARVALKSTLLRTRRGQ